ncbi:hypothetical protein [Lactobacillus sp. 3B(2020)]|uniref:hypothetical protein n=1 Tax=Lactobacillus sp. 3B(2020) TaxID=2695882 RepID=UPI00351B86A6
MKTTKLVLGIIMIVLGVIIFFQSMVAGLGNAIAANNSHSVASGVMVAILYIVVGIVYLATRKSEKMGGDIAGLIISIIAWLMGAFLRRFTSMGVAHFNYWGNVLHLALHVKLQE